jgi:hypothetical protein
MTRSTIRSHPESVTASPHALTRWECRCQQPPVLLATYDDLGRIHIKSRDRYWHIDGVVRTVCPRCGAEHTLDLQVGSRKSGVGSRGPGDG